MTNGRMREDKNMKALKRLGTIVLSAVLWIIILVAALYVFTTMATRDSQKVSNLFGYTPLVVKSDSMAPTFSAGDLILIHTCDPAELKEGDIICFHTIIDNEYALNTHRIQSIASVGDARSYTTIGDNNNGIADTHIISDGDIVGKYVCVIPKAGYVMNFLSGSTGFLVVIVLPMLLFFIYQVYHLIMISISLKKAVAVETAREAELAASQVQSAKAQEAQEKAKQAKSEAEAALEEAKRMREEAEAIRAKAQAELEKAQQKDKDSADSSEEKGTASSAPQADKEAAAGDKQEEKTE